MNTVIITLLVSLLAANLAFAVVDTSENSSGIYFDTAADIYEWASPPYVMVSAYVILTNPTFDALFGYEFGYDIAGSYILTGVSLMGAGPIDVGGDIGNHIVGLAAPLATSPATVLCILSIFILEPNPLAFTLRGVYPGSVGNPGLPAVLLAGDVIIPLGLSADIGNVCAYINGTGVVATEQASWDTVKSLFR